MPRKRCPKLILEGTRLTGKTELAFALEGHPRVTVPRPMRYHAGIVSGEWCAFTNHPWGRGIINYEPQEEARALETYQTWARLFELLPYKAWILDRFHLSTAAFQARHRGRAPDFAWLEERLLPLGFRIVLCTRRPDTFETAREARLAVSANPAQYDDLDRFRVEQEDLRALAAKSRLPVLEVDLSDDDTAAAADRVAGWLESTGGLYLPDGLA